MYGDCAVMLTCLGGAITFVIIASEDLQQAIAPGSPRWPWVLLTFVITVPLSFLRTMDSLRFSSVVGVLFLVYNTALVFIYSLGLGGVLDPFGDGAHVQEAGAFTAFASSKGALRSLSSVATAFACHFSIVGIQSEMCRPTRPRKCLWFGSTFAISYGLYLVVGLCGYFTFGDVVTANVLLMYPQNGLIRVGQIGMAITVMTSYPLVCFGFRLSAVTFAQELLDCFRKTEEPSIEDGRGALESERVSKLSVEPRTLRDSALLNPTVSMGESDVQRLSVARPANSRHTTGFQESTLGSVTAEKAAAAADSTTKQPSKVDETTTQEPTCSFLSRLFIGDKGEAIAVTIIVIASFAVGLITDNLGIVLDVVGALGATSISYIVPGVIYAGMCRPATTPDEPCFLYPLAWAIVPYGIAVLGVSMWLIIEDD